MTGVALLEMGSWLHGRGLHGRGLHGKGLHRCGLRACVRWLSNCMWNGIGCWLDSTLLWRR